MTASRMNPVDNERDVCPRHFHSLDALKGLAAISVVLCHWPFFFHHGRAEASCAPGSLPFHFLLKPLYTDGWRAVDLFFCLSGFIFFWLYAQRIGSGKTSLKEFAVRRFSRLYPLHLVTLLLVAALQLCLRWRQELSFAFERNDLCHFGWQLLLYSGWGLQINPSFNAPIWSVSIEAVLYAIFFLLCARNLRRWWHLALLAGTGYIAIKMGVSPVGRGLLSFFMGGLAFRAFVRLRHSGSPRRWLPRLMALSALLWVCIPINVGYKLIYHLYRDHLWSEGLNVLGKDVGTIIIFAASDFSFETVLFPLTVVTLALWEAERGTLGKRLALLGQISYSSYLMHFPLQIVFFTAATALGARDAFFYSPWSLLLFFSLLLPLSYGTYHFFELPCQELLRARLLKPARLAASELPNLAAEVASPRALAEAAL